MGWYKLLVETSKFGENEENQLANEIQKFALVDPLNNFEDLAVYAKYSYSGKYVKFYFSPKICEIALPLLESYQAEPCNRPSQNKEKEYSELRFKGGDETYWSRSKK